MDTNNIANRSHYVYSKGNYAKVDKFCLSIRHTFSMQHTKIASSFLPLYLGKCVTHNLGMLNYVCTKCGAICWKAEGKSILQFTRRYSCGGGDVKLHALLDAPEELKLLMHNSTTTGRAFLKSICIYNSALAFASLGAHVDEQFTRGGGVYSFRVHGQIYHNIGTLLPSEEIGQMPCFAQLYFYDTEHELQNRLRCVPNVQQNILNDLQEMIH